MNYIDHWQRVGKMASALQQHLREPGALASGTKRQAAYIIADIAPEDAVQLDFQAMQVETLRRATVGERL